MAALACVAGWLMNAVRSSFKTRRRSRIAA
jgi:hypothetical protein